MELTNYKYKANAEIEKTQDAMEPFKDNSWVGIALTFGALIADATQVAHFMMLTNSDFFSSVVSGLMMVFGLDGSMIILATRINNAQISKKGFRDPSFIATVVIFVGAFLFSYLSYYQLASSVLSAARSQVDNFRLTLPLLTSLVSLGASLKVGSKQLRANKLRREKVRLEEDIASANNKINQAEQVSRELNLFQYRKLQLKQELETLISAGKEASLAAHTMLVEELGSEAAADALEKAGVTPDFWAEIEEKLNSFDERDFLALDPDRVTNWTAADRKQPTLIPAMPAGADLDKMTV